MATVNPNMIMFVIITISEIPHTGANMGYPWLIPNQAITTYRGINTYTKIASPIDEVFVH